MYRHLKQPPAHGRKETTRQTEPFGFTTPEEVNLQSLQSLHQAATCFGQSKPICHLRGEVCPAEGKGPKEECHADCNLHNSCNESIFDGRFILSERNAKTKSDIVRVHQSTLDFVYTYPIPIILMSSTAIQRRKRRHVAIRGISPVKTNQNQPSIRNN